jgi:hypothetical protein
MLGLALAACLPALTAATESRDARFSLRWTNNVLRVAAPQLPKGGLEILHLEAFCRSGAHNQSWSRTILPHQTKLIRATADRRRLEFETIVAATVVVNHEVRAEPDSVLFTYRFKNRGREPVDALWFQPACIRVAEFTGGNQETFTGNSFVYTAQGRKPLNQLVRTTNALYAGGQVYLPIDTRIADANPRPICAERITNGLIGCVSADAKLILATASSTTHELFEGVFVCLHSDPHIGGLAPGETKTITSRLYLLPNDPEALLKRYQSDFATQTSE